MKKIIILFLTVMSLQIFGANYKVTGNNLTQKELKTNNSEIEKEIKRFFTEDYSEIFKNELAKRAGGYEELEKAYSIFGNKYLSEIEYKINEINYLSNKKANVTVELKGIDFENFDVEKILDEKNVDNKLIKELFSNLNEEEMAEIFQMDETEAEETIIKKFLPHLMEVVLEEIDRVKTYRVDKIELELDKINGKWEITAEN